MFGQQTIIVTALAYVTFSSIQKNWQGQTRLRNPFFYSRIMQDLFPLSLGTFLESIQKKQLCILFLNPSQTIEHRLVVQRIERGNFSCPNFSPWEKLKQAYDLMLIFSSINVPFILKCGQERRQMHNCSKIRCNSFHCQNCSLRPYFQSLPQILKGLHSISNNQDDNKVYIERKWPQQPSYKGLLTQSLPKLCEITFRQM